MYGFLSDYFLIVRHPFIGYFCYFFLYHLVIVTTGAGAPDGYVPPFSLNQNYEFPDSETSEQVGYGISLGIEALINNFSSIYDAIRSFASTRSINDYSIIPTISTQELIDDEEKLRRLAEQNKDTSIPEGTIPTSLLIDDEEKLRRLIELNKDTSIPEGTIPTSVLRQMMEEELQK